MLIGYAYITNDNAIHVLNMQAKTLSSYMKQSKEILLHQHIHKMRWTIKKKILNEQTA